MSLEAACPMFARTAHALVSAASLSELTVGALEDMRTALALEVAALYVPAADAPPVLERCAVAAASTRQAVARIVFDDAAWQLATAGLAPLVIRDGGTWLVEQPFTPAAPVWLLLPLGTGRHRIGLVIATPVGPGPS